MTHLYRMAALALGMTALPVTSAYSQDRQATS